MRTSGSSGSRRARASRGPPSTSTSPTSAHYWRALVGRFVAATRARIQREQEAGNVDPALPAQAIAFGLCWMTERAAYELLVQDGDLEDGALVDGLLAIWIGAVYGRPR
jgi:TetR/AcrR family transcriptional regulator, ethionamide resistance regulator